MNQPEAGSRHDLIEHRLEEIRHASDYDTFYVASKDITKQQVETAEQLLKLAVAYYNKKQSVT